MKRIKRLFKILTVMLLIFLAVIWFVGERRFSDLLFERLKKQLSEKFDLRIICRRSGFSIVRGFYVSDFFIVDTNGKVVIKADEARFYLSLGLIGKKSTALDRILVSGAEYVVDSDQESKSLDFKKLGIHRYLKHIIFTDLLVVVKKNRKSFEMRQGFLEAFFTATETEGLFRFVDKYGNRSRVLFYGPGVWGFEGNFILDDPAVLWEYREVFPGFPLNIMLRNGSMEGEYSGFFFPEENKKEWKLDLSFSQVSGTILNFDLKKVDGSLRISSRDFDFDLTGEYGHTSLKVMGKGNTDKCNLDIVSEQLFLGDIRKHVPEKFRKVYFSGMGSCEVKITCKGKSVTKANGTLALGATEFLNYTLENGQIRFEYTPDEFSIREGFFVFSSIWDVFVNGKVMLGERTIPLVSFKAQNSIISNLVCHGEFTEKRPMILESELKLSDNSLPFELDLSELPAFKGKLDSEYITATWKGENYFEKREWVALAEFKLDHPSLTAPQAGSLHLKRTRDRVYQIGRGTISNKYGKGEFSGRLGVSASDLKVFWEGSTDAFAFLNSTGLSSAGLVLEGQASGTFFSPVYSCHLEIDRDKAALDLSGNRNGMEIKGMHKGSALSARIAFPEMNWSMDLESNEWTRMPDMVRTFLQTSRMDIQKFRGSFRANGQRTGVNDAGFDCSFSNIDLHDNHAHEIHISGEYGKGQARIDSVEITLPEKGRIRNLERIEIFPEQKKISGGIELVDAKFCYEKLSARLNGKFFLQMKDEPKGVFFLSLDEMLRDQKEMDTLEISGSFDTGTLILNNVKSPNFLVNGWKGSLDIQTETEEIWLAGIDMSSDVFRIKGGISFARPDFSLSDFSLQVNIADNDSQVITVRKNNEVISGIFSIDTVGLKKIDAFDKIPPTVLKGKIMHNHGDFEFSTTYNDQDISGQGEFSLKKSSKNNWDLSGEVFIDESKLELSEKKEFELEELDLTPVNINLRINFGNNVWIRNSFINTEIGGSLLVTGEDYPGVSIAGDVKFVRGTVNYFNQHFDIVSGKAFYQILEKTDGSESQEKVINLDEDQQFDAEYVYDGKKHSIVLSVNESVIEGETNIYLSMLAYKKIRGVDVYLQITGPLSNLQLLAYSNPELEQEKLKRLITGGTLGGIDDDSWDDARFFDALKFNLKEQLMGRVGDNLARGLELEEFDIETSAEDFDEDNLDIKLGKYLSDKVYLRYYRRFRRYEDVDQFELKYKTNKHLFLEGLYDEYKQDYQFGMKYSISF